MLFNINLPWTNGTGSAVDYMVGSILNAGKKALSQLKLELADSDLMPDIKWGVTGMSTAVESHPCDATVTTFTTILSFLRLSQTPQNIPKQKERKVEQSPIYSERQSHFF